jgi:imidazolonepropionase-like amidohydrolase
VLRRAGRLGSALANRAASGIAGIATRRSDRPAGRASSAGAPTRGVAFVGTVWVGGDSTPGPGAVILDSSGKVVSIRHGAEPELPRDLLVLGGGQHWIVPGICDAHVHLGFDPVAVRALQNGVGRCTVSGLDTGVVGLRDLGAPLRSAGRWQTRRRLPIPGAPFVAVAGPILTVPQGYPSATWGADGYAHFVNTAAEAMAAVRQLASEGVDLIKIALERGNADWPVPGPITVRATVRTAHDLGLPVVAHALSADLVTRALDAGVDELAHTPTEPLSADTIERIADARMSVTSTIQTFFSSGEGRAAADNAQALVQAGVILRYGTDLGNAGTRTGVDPRELDRLADTGLGRLGALRAATEWSATAPGMRSRTGMIAEGEPASLVLLPFSPLDEPGVWRTPAAVYTDGRLTVGNTDNSRAANCRTEAGPGARED